MSCTPAYSGWVFWLMSCIGQVSEYNYCMFHNSYPFNNAQSKAVLGIQYRPMSETVADCANSMIDGGYIKGREKKAQV